jgi:phosphoribosylamine--glycine ligase
LKSDLITLMEHAVNGTLDKAEAEWDRRAALGVVMAAAGYPDSPRKGDAIHGLPPVVDLLEETPRDYHVFHAGTAAHGKDVVVSGGRVLCVTALGDKVQLAQKRAYEIAEHIKFDGCQMRHDIGYRAVKTGARG